VPRRALLCVFALPAAICAAWTLFAGKDLNWDLLNYHYYLPFQFLAGRLAQDFFAASAQSYLNPIGHLPFYLMVSSGWHSVAVSIALSLAHSVSIALLYLVSRKLFAHLPQRERIELSCFATALGAATAVFWATVGTSFLDPLLIPLMLAGLLLLLDKRGGTARRAALAGALFGAAAALKYSNAIFAVAALPLALAMPGLSGTARVRAGLAYGLGGILALAVLAGPWCVLLAREFGNPVFPLMNAWFQSPHAPAINMVAERFTPRDLGASLAFPFRMAVLDRALYSETFAPDIRFAALAVAAGVLAILRMMRKAPAAGALGATDWRLLAFLALGAVLWLASSANARYGMMVLLLAGVALARLAERLLPGRVARVVLAVLLVVQATTAALVSPPRWYVVEPWSRRWFPYDVPERALREPALYLTVEFLPMAVMAAFVHPGSSFVNVRGQHSLATDSPRLAALLERHRGSVRTLGRGLELIDGRLRADPLRAYDASLLRIGYRVDAADCFAIPWRRDGDDFLSRAANRLAGPWQHEELSVATCALRPTPRDPADIEAERQASSVFDRIESSCTQLFRGQTAVTERLGGGWSRYYAGLDARLETHSEIVLLHRYRVGSYIPLGRLSEWSRDDSALPAACR
jgi:hypothetical protein